MSQIGKWFVVNRYNHSTVIISKSKCDSKLKSNFNSILDFVSEFFINMLGFYLPYGTSTLSLSISKSL
jgi:hypothetical protein